MPRPRKNPQEATPDNVGKSMAVPDSVYEAKENKAEPSGWEVGESFFAKHDSGFDPGKGIDGMILNHRNFVKDIPKDDKGNDLHEYRFGSKRAGCPERNSARGYTQALINNKGQLDPNGTPVQVAGMTLLVRKKEHGDASRARHEAEVARTAKRTRKQAAEEALDLAKQMGYDDRVVIKGADKTPDSKL